MKRIIRYLRKYRGRYNRFITSIHWKRAIDVINLFLKSQLLFECIFDIFCEVSSVDLWIKEINGTVTHLQ